MQAGRPGAAGIEVGMSSRRHPNPNATPACDVFAGASVLAVETADELAAARGLGVRCGQGFHLATPVPASRVPKVVDVLDTFRSVSMDEAAWLHVLGGRGEHMEPVMRRLVADLVSVRGDELGRK